MKSRFHTTTSMSSLYKKEPPRSLSTQERKQLRDIQLFLRAIHHSLRDSIIAVIQEHGQIKVTDIFIQLRIEQAVASQHLAILRRAGVIVTHREGKCIYYSMSDDYTDRLHYLLDMGNPTGETILTVCH